MYHFIFINEASIETERKKEGKQENTSEKNQKEKEVKKESKKNSDVVMTKEISRPDDIPIIISNN